MKNYTIATKSQGEITLKTPQPFTKYLQIVRKLTASFMENVDYCHGV
jgi:hypothetical protein